MDKSVFLMLCGGAWRQTMVTAQALGVDSYAANTVQLTRN